jgi:hypothetical protein
VRILVTQTVGNYTADKKDERYGYKSCGNSDIAEIIRNGRNKSKEQCDNKADKYADCGDHKEIYEYHFFNVRIICTAYTASHYFGALGVYL